MAPRGRYIYLPILFIVLVFLTLSGCAGLKGAEDGGATGAPAPEADVPQEAAAPAKVEPEPAGEPADETAAGAEAEPEPEGMPVAGPAPDLDPEHVFTLAECVARVKRTSRSMDSAQQDYIAARLRERKAMKDYLPSVNAQYAYVRLDKTPMSGPTVLPGLGAWPGYQVGHRDNYALTLTVAQPLFTGFATTAAHHLAELGLDVAEISTKQTEMDLVLQAKQAYFEVLAAEKSLTVAEQSVQQLEAHLKNAKSFFDVGLTAKNEVLQAEVQLAQAQQDQTLVEHRLNYARAGLNKLLGRSMAAPIKVEDILEHNPIQQTLDECLETGLNYRPEILSARRQVRMADEEITIAKSGFYPTVSLQYNFYKEGDTAAVDGGRYHDDNSWDVTAVASWKIWEWGKTSDDVQLSRIAYRKAKNALDQLKDAIELEIKQSYLNLQAAGRNILVAEKAVEQAEENYRIAQERYKEQVATSTDVLDAETLLTSSRNNRYRSLYDFNVAWAQLERAMGVAPGFAHPATPQK